MPNHTSTLSFAIFTTAPLGKSVGAFFLEKGHNITFFCPAKERNNLDRIGFGNYKDHLFFYNSVQDDRVLNKIISIHTDYIISAYLSEKIPPKIITAASKQAFNLHPSLLPLYRGAQPQFHAIYNQDTVSGLTLHLLSDTWDSGDIISQCTFKLDPTDTSGLINAKAENSIRPLLEQIYPYFLSNTFNPKPQPSSPYLPRLKDKDTLIDWSQTAQSCSALIRACNPILPAYTTINGSLLELLECDITSENLPPGHFKVSNNQLLVGTADHALSITCIRNMYGIFSINRFLTIFNLTDGLFDPL